MNLGSVHGSVHCFVHGFVYPLVHALVYGTWFMVSLIMFFLNMVDYPVFFSSMSTLTLDIIVTLVLVVLEASI